jgi:hypothetical protein
MQMDMFGDSGRLDRNPNCRTNPRRDASSILMQDCAAYRSRNR